MRINKLKIDICDLYTKGDLYGFGKGVFPKNKLRMFLYHPSYFKCSTIGANYGTKNKSNAN